VLKRRHGLRRCLYPGLDGMRRWVGLGVLQTTSSRWGVILRDRAAKPAWSARLANGHAPNHHRRQHPLRAMLPGLCQKEHFCDGK
jgi:hypothetical protein